MESKVIGYCVMEEAATGKLLVGTWTQADADGGHIEPSNFYPTAGSANLGLISALRSEIERLRPKAAAWDDLQASTDRVEARLLADGMQLRGDPDEFTCPGCGATRSGTFFSGCGTRRSDAPASA